MIKLFIKKIINLLLSENIYILPTFIGFNKGNWSVLKKNSFSQYIGTYEIELLPHIVKKIKFNNYKIIYDIGASYGYYSSYFAKKTKAKVFSFEPENKPYEILSKLRKKIGPNLNIINKFLASKDSENSISIRNAFKIYGIPDFIKMDIEGQEEKLLIENINLFVNKKITLIIEVHSKKIENSIIKAFNGINYSAEIIDNNLSTLKIRNVNFNRWIILQYIK
tara:strand:+ start:105 stop:770 length:666 start_codon:yes stop_codon:yes gene_type:complete